MYDGPFLTLGDAQRDQLFRSKQGYFTRITTGADGYLYVFFWL